MILFDPPVVNQHVCQVCGDRFIVSVRGNGPPLDKLKAENVALAKALQHLLAAHPGVVKALGK